MGNISTAMRKSTNGGHETVTCWLTLSFLQRQRGGENGRGCRKTSSLDYSMGPYGARHTSENT